MFKPKCLTCVSSVPIVRQGKDNLPIDIFTISRDRNQNTNTGRKIKAQYSYHIYLFNQNQRMKTIQIVYAPLAKLISKVDCTF